MRSATGKQASQHPPKTKVLTFTFPHGLVAYTATLTAQNQQSD
jgi:hypothetical protein